VSNRHKIPVEGPKSTVDDTAETAAPPPDAATAPADLLAQLQDELEAARHKAQEYSDGWQRERADFVNYRKRVERDLRDMQKNAAADTLMLLLPTLDDFERATAHVPDDLRQQPWVEGIVAIQRKLQKTLEEQGITMLDPVGDVFDPARHEAIAVDNSTDIPSGHVTATLQKGYLYGDRVLRPALVRVAS
jgi:molecular chaperone GrpE